MSASDKELGKRHSRTATMLGLLVVTMAGASYAAVPLYQMFCQVTGFAGTTQRAEKAPDASRVLGRQIIVRFDANTRKGLTWDFEPVERQVTLKIGENKLAFYQAKNTSDESVTGTATFNVAPAIAGSYFNKIECFCFTEQTLAPGQMVDMPVSFFIDPEIANDPDAKNVREITLSYTFYPVDKPEKQAKAGQIDQNAAAGRTVN